MRTTEQKMITAEQKMRINGIEMKTTEVKMIINGI